MDVFHRLWNSTEPDPSHRLNSENSHVYLLLKVYSRNKGARNVKARGGTTYWIFFFEMTEISSWLSRCPYNISSVKIHYWSWLLYVYNKIIIKELRQYIAYKKNIL